MSTKKAAANPRSGPKSTYKRDGEHAEAAFLERATHHRLAVAKPWGDSDRYDFVVDGGGRFWRVQVKSCSHQIAGRYGYPFMAHSWERGSHKRIYTPGEIDILATYVVPERLWYIIPIQVPRRRPLLHPLLSPARPRTRRSTPRPQLRTIPRSLVAPPRRTLSASIRLAEREVLGVGLVS